MGGGGFVGEVGALEGGPPERLVDRMADSRWFTLLLLGGMVLPLAVLLA